MHIETLWASRQNRGYCVGIYNRGENKFSQKFYWHNLKYNNISVQFLSCSCNEKDGIIPLVGDDISYLWASALVFPIPKVCYKCSPLSANLQRNFILETVFPHRHCQILISVHELVILIEHVHSLRAIYQILLYFLNICLLVCHYFVD